MKDVSIIIPTYNRPDDLDVVLPFYFQDEVLEIIIIDDGSKLSYNDVIEKYIKCAPCNIIYHRNSTNMGAGASRNIGILLSKGKYILWGEDDAYLSPDYVQVLRSKIVGKQVLFGSIYYGIHPTMSEKAKEEIVKKQQSSNKYLFDYDLLEGYYRLETKNDVIVPWGHALLMVEKKAYEGVEYYEGYKVNGYREETDAQVQITRKGYDIIYTANTCCYHFPAKNKKGGQHSSNVLKFELYKIINNNIFLDRHFDFLSNKYELNNKRITLKIRFAKNIICIMLDRILTKLKREITTK